MATGPRDCKDPTVPQRRMNERGRQRQPGRIRRGAHLPSPRAAAESSIQVSRILVIVLTIILLIWGICFLAEFTCLL